MSLSSFRVYIASSKHKGSWENSRQFCKPDKQSSIAFIKYFSKIIRQMKENADFFSCLLIERDFLDTRSYFLPANQNARLTIHNQSKFV